MSYYKHFQKKIISDWREYYISYKLFKQLLLPFKITSKIYGKFVEAKLLQPNQINSRESVKEIGEEIDHLKIFEYKFKSLMVVEAEKIESFFQLKFLETQVDWVKFQENAEYFWPFRLEKSFYQKGLEMKAAFQVFYKKVNYLIKYVNMNCDALTRLLRKHRKITKNYSNMMKISDLKLENLFINQYIMQNSEELIHLRDVVTTVYLELFYHRYNKEDGVKELKCLLSTKIIPINHRYFFFFFLGASLASLFFIILIKTHNNNDPYQEIHFQYIFPMFRGGFLIVLYMWLMGWNVYIWTRYNINYKKIFRFNYHSSSTTEILIRAAFFTTVLLFTFICFIALNEKKGIWELKTKLIPKDFLPLFLWVLLIGFLFFPSKKLFNGEGRKYFFIRLYRFFSFQVDYSTIWLADQIMSFVIPLQDLGYTFCYYISRIKDYDDRNPSHCFSDTRLIGFSLVLLLILVRIVYLTHSLFMGIRKVKEKENIIEKIKSLREKQLTLNDNYFYEESDKNSSINNVNNNDIFSDENNASSLKQPLMEEASIFKFIQESYHEKSINQQNPQISKLLQQVNLIKNSQNLKIIYFISNILILIVIIFSYLVSLKSDHNLIYLIFWIISAFITATFFYYIDVTKEWGFFQKNRKHPWLREKLGYRRKTLYYIALIMDLFLRYIWVCSISLCVFNSQIDNPQFFIFFMGGFEMLRRAIWNFMTIETIFVKDFESYKCLYEYQLPFSQEEIEKKNVVQVENQEKNFFESLLVKKNKKTEGNVLKKEVLEDFEENFFNKKNEESDSKSQINDSFQRNKLMESIIKGKHATNSLLTLKSEVNLYKESIVRIYEKNHHKSPKK